jgi:hypothetical protein
LLSVTVTATEVVPLDDTVPVTFPVALSNVIPDIAGVMLYDEYTPVPPSTVIRSNGVV